MSEDMLGTELLRACTDHQQELAIALVDQGADVNCIDQRNRDSPLLLACGESLDKLARKLIDAGADVNACNIHGMTPLSMACRMSLSDLALLLANRGANVNHGSQNDDMTPLFWACYNNLPGVALGLIALGANLRDDDALGWAMRNEMISVCRELFVKRRVAIPRICGESKKAFLRGLFYQDAWKTLGYFVCGQKCAATTKVQLLLPLPQLCVDLIVKHVFEICDQEINALLV